MKSKFLLLMAFLPLFSFADFTMNDSDNLEECSDRLYDIMLQAHLIDDVLNNIKTIVGDIADSPGSGGNTNFVNYTSQLNSLVSSLVQVAGLCDSMLVNLVHLDDRLQNLGYDVSDISSNLQDFKSQNLSLLSEIIEINDAGATSLINIEDNLHWYSENSYQFYSNTTNSLSQITSKLMVLASIDQSTAGTYTNLYNLSVNLTNGVFKSSLSGVFVDLGPTNQLKHTLYPGGLTYSSYYDLDPSTVTAAGTTFYISKSGYLNRIVDTLLRTEMYIRDVKKASMITAEDSFWMTNYLGEVQRPLLTSIDTHSSSIDSSTADILSILREMRQSDSNNLEQISQAKSSAEESAESAAAQQPFNLSYTASVGDLQLSDYLDPGNVFASLPTPNQAPSDIVFSVGTYKVGNNYLFNDEQITINVPRNMEVVLQICRAAAAFLWWLLVAFIVKCLWSRVVWLYEKVVAFTSSIAQV